MKLPPQMIAEEWGIIDPNQPVDPIVYTQVFSPEFPNSVTPNNSSAFQKTTDALVFQKDELAGVSSAPPEIPVQQPNLTRIVLIGVGLILVYKLILKKG